MRCVSEVMSGLLHRFFAPGSQGRASKASQLWSSVLAWEAVAFLQAPLVLPMSCAPKAAQILKNFYH